MTGVNRYYRFSKISEAKFRSLLRCFALDMTATQTARMSGISLRSVNHIYLRLREKLAKECEIKSPFAGELEADESYFGVPSAPILSAFAQQRISLSAAKAVRRCPGRRTATVRATHAGDG
jgi:hypothetical protein